MVGKAVAVLIEEDKVAHPWGHRSDGGIESGSRQLLRPVDAAGGIGEDRLLNACIVQTERGEHGAPFAIRIAEPCAVARIAVEPAVFINGIVAAALCVAKLAVCDCRNICGQIIREILRNRPLPYGGGLQIGRGVGIADQTVCMLFFFADEPVFIAGFRVLMQHRRFFALLLPAGEHPTCAVTVGRMLVSEVLLQTADDIARFIIAVRRVQVGALALCKFADQNGLLLITCVRVDVFRLLRRVFIRRILSADQHARIAAFRIVDMLFLSAERLLRHCNRWKDQRIGRAEHDDAGERRHDAAPFFLLEMCFQIVDCPNRQMSPHADTSSLFFRLFVHVLLHY